jgi:addiction module HigA family antidote
MTQWRRRIDQRLGNELPEVPTVTPGEVLTHQFILQRHLKSTWVAREIGVPVNRITEIQCGRRRITAETALLFARYFETSAEFWMRLQMEYDLRMAARRSPTTRHALFDTGGTHEL